MVVRKGRRAKREAQSATVWGVSVPCRSRTGAPRRPEMPVEAHVCLICRRRNLTWQALAEYGPIQVIRAAFCDAACRRCFGVPISLLETAGGFFLSAGFFLSGGFFPSGYRHWLLLHFWRLYLPHVRRLHFLHSWRLHFWHRHFPYFLQSLRLPDCAREVLAGSLLLSSVCQGLRVSHWSLRSMSG